MPHENFAGLRRDETPIGIMMNVPSLSSVCGRGAIRLIGVAALPLYLIVEHCSLLLSL